MKRIIYILVIAGLTGNLLAACQKEPAAEQRKVVLDVCPMIDVAPATKNAVIHNSGDGSGHYYMPGGANFGLFICEHHTGSYTDGSNPYNEYAPRYKNILVRGGYGNLRYNYFNYNDFPTLYLVPRDEDRNGVTDCRCDIFAYSPYQADITRLEAIPFSITNQIDVMYAHENGVANLNIDPADYVDAGRIEVPLTFHHVLSLLEFDIKLKYDTYNHPWGPFGSIYSEKTIEHVLESMTINTVHSSAHLYSDGKMNAMTGGTIFDLTETSTITVSAFGANSYSPVHAISVVPERTAIAYVVLVPTTFDGAGDEDCVYRIAFKFSDQDFPIIFSLKKKHLKHSGSTPTYGLQANYKYTFHFTIDNYIHLDDVEVGEWETVDIPFQKEL